MDNRRKHIVINKAFQYRYTILTVLMAVVFVNLFAVLGMAFPGPVSIHLDGASAMVLALFELALVVAIIFGTLKASHRVAGPVFVINRELNAFCDGQLDARIRLREGDMFVPEAEQINRALDTLQQRIVAVQEAAASLPASDASAELLARLERIGR